MQDWIRQVLHLPSKEHALLLLRPLIKPFSYFIEHSYRSVDLEAVAGSIETSQELQFINLWSLHLVNKRKGQPCSLVYCDSKRKEEKKKKRWTGGRPHQYNVSLLWPFLSLSLSHTHTHTHTNTHQHSLTHTDTPTLTHKHNLLLSLAHSLQLNSLYH